MSQLYNLLLPEEEIHNLLPEEVYNTPPDYVPGQDDMPQDVDQEATQDAEEYPRSLSSTSDRPDSDFVLSDVEEEKEIVVVLHAEFKYGHYIVSAMDKQSNVVDFISKDHAAPGMILSLLRRGGQVYDWNCSRVLSVSKTQDLMGVARAVEHARNLASTLKDQFTIARNSLVERKLELQQALDVHL